eukprot:1614850-Prymnesium_polylepis.1
MPGTKGGGGGEGGEGGDGGRVSGGGTCGGGKDVECTDRGQSGGAGGGGIGPGCWLQHSRLSPLAVGQHSPARLEHAGVRAQAIRVRRCKQMLDSVSTLSMFIYGKRTVRGTTAGNSGSCSPQATWAHALQDELILMADGR